MKREELLADDLDSRSSRATTSCTSVEREALEEGGGRMRSFSVSGGRRRISGEPSNQVEMIADDTRMAKDDNDHSFELLQPTTTARPPRDPPAPSRTEEAALGATRDEEANKAAQEAEGSLLLVGERNEWGSMMEQIVESAESKLMRHRRLHEGMNKQPHPIRFGALEQAAVPDLDPASAAGAMSQDEKPMVMVGQGHGHDEMVVAVVGARGEAQQISRLATANRIKAKALLLKSPAFARNTLDDAEIDKLAASKESQWADSSSGQIVISGTTIGTGSTKTLDPPLSDSGHHHERQIVTDCGGNSSANMINRRQEDGAPIGCSGSGNDKQQQQQQRDYMSVTAGYTTTNTVSCRSIEQRGSVVTKQVAVAAELTSEPTSMDRSRRSRSLIPSLGGLAVGHQNKPDHDQDDERGGPTPTNDLIRTLIHRDRLALLASGGAQIQQATLTAGPKTATESSSSSLSSCPSPAKSGQQHRRAASKDCGLGSGPEESIVAQRPLVSGATGTHTNEIQTTTIRAEMAAEPNLTSGAAHNNDTYLVHCCYHHRIGHQEEGATISGIGTSHGIKFGPKTQAQTDSCIKSGQQREASQPAAARQASQANLYDASGLSALIDKYHRLQLSPEVTEGAAFDQQQQQHLVASSRVGTSSQNLSTMVTEPVPSVTTGHPRSIYMFPRLLITHKAPVSDDEEDSDDESEDVSGFQSGTSTNNDGSPIHRNQRSRRETDQFASLNTTRLHPSASSPSALSTPTNESGGCGGACCSRQAQLAKLASENRQSLAQSRRGLLQSAIDLNNEPKSVHRKVSLSGSDLLYHETSSDPRRRQTMASTPTDRLKSFVGRENIAPSLSQTIHQSSGKRHSIISALTGHHSGQLASIFLHPRSFFSNHLNQQLHNSNKKHRASVECTSEHLEHYDPLIPDIGFKIVVLGTSGSGKTSIIQRFMYDSFSWRHIPTVEDTYFIEFPYMKNMINISISDTSGTYQFPAMRRLAISSGDAFILVYSVDDPKSFDELEQLRKTILEEREQAFSEASASSIMSSTSGSTSGIESGHSPSSSASHSTSLATSQHLQQQQLHRKSVNHPVSDRVHAESSVSPARHWSLASIFQHNQPAPQSGGQLGSAQCSANQSSLHSSVGSFSSSCSNNSADHSRRSSVSAAEAALRTRRTRHPPMVIVANKYDLPEEQHLVNSDEIEALVEIDWNNGFVRASAALNLNINEIFQQVLKQARQPPTLTAAIVSKRRKSLPPKLPQSMGSTNLT